MSVTLSHYWPLLLLLALPPVWWMKAHTAVGLSARHLLASTIVRTAVIVFLTLALAQPVWNRAGKWISVVYALDISSSIDPDFVDSSDRDPALEVRIIANKTPELPAQRFRQWK